jgi:hypothetical protein
LLHSLRDLHEPAVHVRRETLDQANCRRRDHDRHQRGGSFTVPFKLALVLALGMAMPFVLYQAWAFVAPGTLPPRKKLAVPLLISSVLCSIWAPRSPTTWFFPSC